MARSRLLNATAPSAKALLSAKPCDSPSTAPEGRAGETGPNAGRGPRAPAARWCTAKESNLQPTSMERLAFARGVSVWVGGVSLPTRFGQGYLKPGPIVSPLSGQPGIDVQSP
jgi:hypothetical protein